MGRRLVSTKDMSREDWLELRRKSLGGSDAAAVLGESPWKSPLTLYAEKKGLIDDKVTSEAMRQGTDLEAYVANRFMEATGKKVRRSNFMYMHDYHDFITANIDRDVVDENAGLECKVMNVYSDAKLRQEGHHLIPEQYYYQCQHYMMVMGYDHMYLAVLVPPFDFWWEKIDRNDDAIESLLHREIEFWINHIEQSQPPEADGSESSLSTLAWLHPQDNGEEVWIDTDMEIQRYQELTQTIKRMEKQKDELRARICSDIGDASFGRSDKYVVSWKAQEKTGIDSKYLRENYPEVYEECKTHTSFRVMRIKEIKEDK